MKNALRWYSLPREGDEGGMIEDIPKPEEKPSDKKEVAGSERETLGDPEE